MVFPNFYLLNVCHITMSLVFWTKSPNLSEDYLVVIAHQMGFFSCDKNLWATLLQLSNTPHSQINYSQRLYFTSQDLFTSRDLFMKVCTFHIVSYYFSTFLAGACMCWGHREETVSTTLYFFWLKCGPRCTKSCSNKDSAELEAESLFQEV